MCYNWMLFKTIEPKTIDVLILKEQTITVTPASSADTLDI